VLEQVTKDTTEETAMNLEIFTPLTDSYEEHLKRLSEYQEAYLKHNRTLPANNLLRVQPFSFSDSNLLRLTVEEEAWIKREVVKAANDSLENHCLSMMNSIAAHLRSVCECTVAHTSKKYVLDVHHQGICSSLI